MTDQSTGHVPYSHNTLMDENNPEAFQWWYFDAEFEQGKDSLISEHRYRADRGIVYSCGDKTRYNTLKMCASMHPNSRAALLALGK